MQNKEKIKILKEKNFIGEEANVQNFITWLVMAEEIVKVDSEEVSDIEEVKDFIYQELNNLLSGKSKSEDGREQNITKELESVVKIKEADINKIKEIIEVSKNNKSESSSIKRNSSVLKSVEAWKKLRKNRKSQIVNNSKVMKVNQTCLGSVKMLLSDAKKKLNNNPEAEVLSQRIGGILEQTEEDKLKVECEKLQQELNDGEYENISNLSSALSRILLKYYLDNWYTEENELNNEQKEKLKKADEVEKERDELKQEIEELKKQGGGVGVNDDDKNELEKLVDIVRKTVKMNDDELTNSLSWETNWRSKLKESNKSLDLASRFGEIMVCFQRVEKDKKVKQLEQTIEELEKQGGVDDESKKNLENQIDDVFLEAYDVKEDELTGELEENKTWRTWLVESDDSYELAYRYGEIVGTIKRIHYGKEKEKLEKKILERDEKLEKKEQQIEELVNSSNIPPTPMTSTGRQEETAQDWLENNYGKDKKDVDEIALDSSKINLTGHLEIKDYPELISINLQDMKLTKLIIENCPKVEEIAICGNEITEIVGLDGLPNLSSLNCTSNRISRIDIINNSKLSEFTFGDNPNIQVVGLKNLSTLIEFRGDEPLNMEKMIEEEWEEAAKELKIDKKELENKTREEIKKLIQREGEIIQAIETKINDLANGLLKNRKIDEDELARIKQTLSEVGKLKEELENSNKETNLAKMRENEEREKRRWEKRLKEIAMQIYENELIKRLGKPGIQKLREKAEQKAERELKKEEKLEANIEVNDNKQ